jgi:hypothetical protein
MAPHSPPHSSLFGLVTFFAVFTTATFLTLAGQGAIPTSNSKEKSADRLHICAIWAFPNKYGPKTQGKVENSADNSTPHVIGGMEGSDLDKICTAAATCPNHGERSEGSDSDKIQTAQKQCGQFNGSCDWWDGRLRRRQNPHSTKERNMIHCSCFLAHGVLVELAQVGCGLASSSGTSLLYHKCNKAGRALYHSTAPEYV